MIHICKRLFVYAFLVFLTALLIGIGFHTAEKGINAMTGTDRPPKTIDVKTDPAAVQVTFLGKKVVQPKPTLGDEWSASLDSTSASMGSLIDRFAFETGNLLQRIAQLTIEWIAGIVGGIVQTAMAFF